MHSAPSQDEIEVSLFGPGYGECVVIHLGVGNWIVVDSCLTRNSHRPVAIEYLEELGIDSEKAICLILATHWHDDHIRGLGQLLEMAKAARFACSGAIGSKEFKDLLAFSYSADLQTGGSGMSEIRRALKVVQSSGRLSPVLATASKVLLERTELQYPVDIRALSPSDAAQLYSISALSCIKNKYGQRRRLPYVSPNDASVALSVRVGPHSILLGADLEENGRAEMGWTSVISDHPEERQPSSIFKVPHHGSETGHHREVWNKILSPTPIAILTPYTRGKRPLPAVEDLNRLKTFTSELYLSAPHKKLRYKDSNRIVDKVLKGTARSVVRANTGWGHIRARLPIASSRNCWKVETFGDAYKVD